MGMSWGFERGALPRCSSTALWAISCDAMVAKTLGPQRQQGIAYPWVEMWRMCGYSGPMSTGHGTLEVQHGCVHAYLAMSPLAIDGQVAKALLGVLGKMRVDITEVPVPMLALALERCGSLRVQDQEHLQSMARGLAKPFLDTLDKFILERSASILTQELTVTPRYLYRSGHRQTHHDRRQQV